MSQIDRNHSSKAPYHKAHGAPTPASPSTPSSPSSGKSKKKEVEQKTESVQKSTDSSRKEWNPKGSDLSKDRMNKPDEVNVYPGHGPFTSIGHEKKHNPFFTGDSVNAPTY